RPRVGQHGREAARIPRRRADGRRGARRSRADRSDQSRRHGRDAHRFVRSRAADGAPQAGGSRMNAILVINAGSSSLKFALFPHETGTLAATPAVSGQIEGIGATPELSAKNGNGRRYQESLAVSGNLEEQHRDSLANLVRSLQATAPGPKIDASGQRIVLSGARVRAPVRRDEDLLWELDRLIPLAPLHQPHNLRAVRAVSALMADIPQVACFDTAFHRTQPAVAQAFALPRKLSAEGIKRYGFHGLSY